MFAYCRKGRARVARPKRIFISFAMEDEWARNMLRGQSKLGDSPIEYADFSVKEPWDSAWQTKCRTRIKGCDGVIAFISSNTKAAAGARWEIGCAVEEGVPRRRHLRPYRSAVSRLGAARSAA